MAFPFFFVKQEWNVNWYLGEFIETELESWYNNKIAQNLQKKFNI